MHVKEQISNVQLRAADGFIEALQMRSGLIVAADLFVDCSDDRSLLLEQALGVPRVDWNALLPVDRRISVTRAATDDLPVCRTLRSEVLGWSLTSALRSTCEQQLHFASAITSDEEAAAALGQTPVASQPTIESFNPGRALTPWHRNCVAIGAAACRLEDLSPIALHLVQSGVSRLIAHFPDRSCALGEAEEFNRIMTGEFDRLRDFHALHYILGARMESPFWQRCRELVVPESLQRKIELFKARGRVVSYDGEVFDDQTWAATLLGLGIVPERTDPLLDNVDPQAAQQLLRDIAATVSRAVDSMEDHASALQRALAERARI
jgi:tryptophan halogenase